MIFTIYYLFSSQTCAGGGWFALRLHHSHLLTNDVVLTTLATVVGISLARSRAVTRSDRLIENVVVLTYFLRLSLTNLAVLGLLPQLDTLAQDVDARIFASGMPRLSCGLLKSGLPLDTLAHDV